MGVKNAIFQKIDSVKLTIYWSVLVAMATATPKNKLSRILPSDT